MSIANFRERKRYLAEWLDAHGISERVAYRASGLHADTWEWLMRGYPTVPSLALRVGTALGMGPKEVKPLGQQLRPEIWRAPAGPVPEGSWKMNTTNERLRTLWEMESDAEWYKRLRPRPRVVRALQEASAP